MVWSSVKRKQNERLSLYDGVPVGAVDDDGTVIVIGAGVSGLSAARVLHDNGRSVVVIEGRDRIGGRLHTVGFGGTPVDEGGNWIHGVPENPLYHLVKEAGIATREEDFGHPLRMKVFDSGIKQTRGIIRTLYMLWKANRLVEKMTGNSLSIQHTEATLAERFEKAIGEIRSATNQRLFQFGLRTVVDLTMAETSDKLHPNALAINPDYHNTSDHVIEGGYHRMIERLAGGVDIHLGCTVMQIDYHDTGVTVTTNQKVYHGSHVIVTVPLGVLKADKIQFNPPLPDAKTQAIETLGFGNVEKIFLKFATAFWHSSSNQTKHLLHVSDTVGDFPAFLDLTLSSGQPMLVTVLSGDQARQLAEDAEPMIQRACDILRLMFPGEYQDPIAVHVSNWQKDPFAGGSYSTPVVASSADDYDQLAIPVNGRLLFAGEATYREHAGFVEGAMGSGVREARRILGTDVDLTL